MKKYNVAIKNSHGKWRTFMYGTQFDNGGIVVKLTKKKLEEINTAIASGELTFDQYGNLQFSLFDDDRDNKPSTHQQAKQNGYQDDGFNAPSPGLKSDSPPF